MHGSVSSTRQSFLTWCSYAKILKSCISPISCRWFGPSPVCSHQNSFGSGLRPDREAGQGPAVWAAPGLKIRTNRGNQLWSVQHRRNVQFPHVPTQQSFLQPPLEAASDQNWNIQTEKLFLPLVLFQPHSADLCLVKNKCLYIQTLWNVFKRF